MKPHKTSLGPASLGEGEYSLFDGGPPLRLLRLWGRFDPEQRHVGRRAAIVVRVGYALRLVPVELRSAMTLGAATALPFGVVALTLVPFDEVLKKLVGVFL